MFFSPSSRLGSPWLMSVDIEGGDFHRERPVRGCSPGQLAEDELRNVAPCRQLEGPTHGLLRPRNSTHPGAPHRVMGTPAGPPGEVTARLHFRRVAWKGRRRIMHRSPRAPRCAPGGEQRAFGGAFAGGHSLLALAGIIERLLPGRLGHEPDRLAEAPRILPDSVVVLLPAMQVADPIDQTDCCGARERRPRVAE
jgi:hypothetical protein